ncbi:hypothetical protein SFUMM280S_03340 [Streptomyces fumanus]
MRASHSIGQGTQEFADDLGVPWIRTLPGIGYGPGGLSGRPLLGD